MGKPVNKAVSAIELFSAAGRADLHGVGLAMPDAGANQVPEFIHLLPAGEIRTADGRGPYKVANAQALIAESLKGDRKLVIDINHATDLLAGRGEDAPAFGWIVDLEARQDGIWGKVEWTSKGRRKVAGREYRYISPALHRDGKFNVRAILRASLVNNPNLLGLTELNQEQDMNLLEQLRKRLGLDADASEEAIMTSVESLQSSVTDLQGQMSQVVAAAKQEDGVKIVDLCAAITEFAGRPEKAEQGIDKDQLVTELQSSLKSATDRISELEGSGKRAKAETFVDTAIREGRVGVKGQRDRFIDLHMKDPANAEAMINDLPKLNSTGTSLLPPKPKDGEAVELNAAQSQVAKLMGIDPKKMAERVAAEGRIQETL